MVRAMSTAQLRPMGVGEILDAAIKVFTRNFGTLLKAVLVVLVPLVLLQLVVSASTAPEDADPDLPGLQPAADGTSAAEIGGTVVSTAITAVLFTVAIAVLYKAIGDAHLGRRPDWRDSLRFAWSRIRSLLWLGLLSALAYGALWGMANLVRLETILVVVTIAAVLAAIYIGVSWVVAVPSLLNEDVRGVAALRRSHQLVRGRWWPMFGLLIVSALMVFVVAFIIGFIYGIISFSSDALADASSLGSLASGAIVNLLVNALALPFLAAVVTLAYFDLRSRKEGYDLELAAGADDATGQPGVQPPAGGATTPSGTGSGAAPAPAGPPPTPGTGSSTSSSPAG